MKHCIIFMSCCSNCMGRLKIKSRKKPEVNASYVGAVVETINLIVGRALPPFVTNLIALSPAYFGENIYSISVSIISTDPQCISKALLDALIELSLWSWLVCPKYSDFELRSTSSASSEVSYSKSMFLFAVLNV